jgi:carbonic anhydrase
MSDLPQLLEGNRRFSERFADGDLAIRPRLSTVVLTCLDARVDPAHLFDLRLGDALVIRNAGGRVNSGVLTDLAVLGLLAAALPGGTAVAPELVILHHTDCGMSRFADPVAQQALADRLGVGSDQVAETMAIIDPAESVRDDIARLSRMPGPPDTLVVSGLVYDTAKGTVEEIVAPTPLRDIEDVGPS